MVGKLACECEERFETRINSYDLYLELKDFFEGEVKRGAFEDIPILKPLQSFDGLGKVHAQWYPDKWYRCKICGQLWAFVYPDFPIPGHVYKLDANGNREERRVGGMESIQNTALLNVIRLMRADQSKEPMFFEALHQAKLLCPILMETRGLPKSADGSVILSSDVPISLVSISDPSGAHYLMAFTDRNELGKWNQGRNQQVLVYTFADYQKALASGDSPYRGVVLNPFGENIVLGKEVFAGGNSPFQTVKSNETIMIGQPKDRPDRLIEMLKQYFRRNRMVKAAYLLWMVRGMEAGYLLVLGTEA